ncbi:cell division/cell wall cluster transcriptional repressor MraZ [Pseudooceanicola sp. 216_PA32_1]|uniref:Transcriptional regulator MraZ n=1 Tax=Pseudooceanicola pacificus TaxID=2676438 RepID=A0A844W381_9RHOB|nr:cell division/cell wall cluster transcriptional repressor MraZ [Pseudooceanicola pacificus]MWB78636.1 cell division/cell wall cluster transcriptional repressor MraZ [Pseudooceanicola pacificus]
MDSKGRVLLLPDWRRFLESGNADHTPGDAPSMVIVYGDHLYGYVEGYTHDEMESVEADIDALPDGSDDREAMEQFILTQSKTVSLDDTGRLVLPAHMRDKLGVANGSGIYVRGRGRTFEIWNAETYAKVKDQKVNRWLDGKDGGQAARQLLDSARRSRTGDE